jgi:hypothetical protein
MQMLKAKKDEMIRVETVKGIINVIYTNAIQAAETKGHTSYSLDIDQYKNRRRTNIVNDDSNTEYKFYKDNMDEILSGLQKLFPGCTVKLANMCTGNDGKRYDISTMDEKMLPFINQKNAFECIVVDWS